MDVNMLKKRINIMPNMPTIKLVIALAPRLDEYSMASSLLSL
jgi:hypothetical protein